MFSHLAAQMAKNFVSVIQLDTKVTAFKSFNSLSFKQDGVVLLFRQTNFPSLACPRVYPSKLATLEMSTILRIELF